MEYFTKIFYSILLISIWFLILKYRIKIKSFTWDFVWAEAYLWRWTTYLIIILIWFILLTVWVSIPFWSMDFLKTK